MIPKKLHFTFASNDLPKIYRDNLDKWKKMCPDWELHFYTDEDIYAFFSQHFPEYSRELQKVPLGVMLADLFRYACLTIHGGLYSDIDTVPIKKIPEKWLSYNCVIGYEYQPSKFPEMFRHPWYEDEFICQWTLLGAPKYLLYKEALSLAFERLRENTFQVKSVSDVLHMTGPFLITDAAKPFHGRNDFLLLDADYFGCREDENFSFTDRSVIHHQFHGKAHWKAEIKLSHLNLGFG